MLGDEIRKARKALSINQTKLGELVGVSLDTVSRWEKGIREPRSGELAKLAEVLNISPEVLINPENGREIRLILDKEGEFFMNINICGGAVDKFVGVSKSDITLHLKAPIRSAAELEGLINNFRAMGLEALKKQEEWRLEDENNTASGKD